MFTTGIFTTHIPYLAFVCMYIILLMNGNGKLPGYVPVAEQEVIKNRHLFQYSNYSEQFHDEQLKVNIHPSFKLSPAIQIPVLKKKHALLDMNSFIQEMDDYGIFCRPPPGYSAGII